MRLSAEVYESDVPIHLTIVANEGAPFVDADLARVVTEAIETTAVKLGFELYAYCLMPDHLHVLLSPAASGRAVSEWLRRFKSFTTRWFQRQTAVGRLWQLSARDRVMRRSESIMNLASYIAENPVRRGLVERWSDWPYTRLFVE